MRLGVFQLRVGEKLEGVGRGAPRAKKKHVRQRSFPSLLSANRKKPIFVESRSHLWPVSHLPLNVFQPTKETPRIAKEKHTAYNPRKLGIWKENQINRSSKSKPSYLVLPTRFSSVGFPQLTPRFLGLFCGCASRPRFLVPQHARPDGHGVAQADGDSRKDLRRAQRKRMRNQTLETTARTVARDLRPTMHQKPLDGCSAQNVDTPSHGRFFLSFLFRVLRGAVAKPAREKIHPYSCK